MILRFGKKPFVSSKITGGRPPVGVCSCCVVFISAPRLYLDCVHDHESWVSEDCVIRCTTLWCSELERTALSDRDYLVLFATTHEYAISNYRNSIALIVLISPSLQFLKACTKIKKKIHLRSVFSVITMFENCTSEIYADAVIAYYFLLC